MKNIRNYGIVTGRLTRDPAVYNNNDGSRKIRFTVAAQDHFTDGDGNRGSQFIPLEAFIPARQQGNGPYDYLDCGDLVQPRGGCPGLPLGFCRGCGTMPRKTAWVYPACP